MSVDGVIVTVPPLAASRSHFGVGQEVAVHVVDVGAEQAVALEVGDRVAGAGHPDVDRDRQPEVAGEGVVLDVAGGAGEGRPAQPHPHPQPPVAAGGEVLVAHPAGVGRVRRVRVVGGGPGAAVEEVAADPRVPQPPQVRVGVRGRLVVVRPVGDRGDPGVERLQGAPQGAGVDVVRRVPQGDAGQHRGPVPGAGDLRRVAADGALPHVPVGVHQARDDQAAGRVDDLGVGRRGPQVGADGGDHAVGGEDVADRQVAQVRVHGDDVAPLDQEFLRHG